MKLDVINEKPWYKDGLPFSCTGCGKCCTGSPGYVWLSQDEINAIADYLKLPVDQFMRTYIRTKDFRPALIEKGEHDSYDCVFLHNKQCQIYPVRPKQCKTFPFWEGHLSSRENWEDAAKYCEGIHPDAPVVSFEKIQAYAAGEKEEKNK